MCEIQRETEEGKSQKMFIFSSQWGHSWRIIRLRLTDTFEFFIVSKTFVDEGENGGKG